MFYYAGFHFKHNKHFNAFICFMKLVEQHIIKSSDKRYKELDHLCFLSKNLYNQALYRIRQQFFTDKTFKDYYKLNVELKQENQIDYRALPANTAQETLKLVCQNYKTFFQSLRKGIKSARIPGYLDKNKGRQVVIYNHMTLSSKMLEYGIIKLPKIGLQFRTKHTKICQVRLVPRNNYIILEVIYESSIKELLTDNKRYMAIDLGIDNLTSCSSNVVSSFIVNGKPIKSINQYYNKKKSKLQSELELKNKKKSSKQIQNLTLKRNNKIKDYFHKASRYIVNQLVNQSINTLIIGKNDGWKQETNIGKKNNQNLVSIPHNQFISMLKYKCMLEGINVVMQEESYTSKCSFFDNDFIPTYGQNNQTSKPSGKRIKRGLYKTSNGLILNADINGSLNILRKYLNVGCDEIISPTSRGLVVNPVKISF